MVKKIELKAEKREKEVKPNFLREKGLIPVVLYGQGTEAESLQIKSNEFEKVLNIAGESSLIDLKVKDGEEIKTIVKNVQKDTLRNKVLHVDLYKIDMKTAIETEIPIHFEGEAKAEKELGGTLVRSLEALHVKCLPGDLVEFFVADLSKLATFDDSIRVSDIAVGDSIEVIANIEDMVANVVPPRIVSEEDEAEKGEEGEAGAEGEETKDGEGEASGEEAKKE